MKTKSFLIFSACCLMALMFTGCGNGKVESAASKLGDDISNTVSRVESALDPDHDDNSSGFPDEDEKSSMPDYSSSQGGGINSGDDDIENGTESDGQVSSDVSGLDDGSSADSSSERTKDL